MNKWCEFCDKGTGCKIYPTRPSECRTFNCLWLSDENFPDVF
jgi:Fe-S-cluster containining protein